MSSLEDVAQDCATARLRLAKVLMPVADRIIEATLCSGMIGEELYAGYIVQHDGDGGHILTKKVSSTESITIYNGASLTVLGVFAEDLLNGMVKGIENVLTAHAQKAGQVFKELKNSGKLELAVQEP